MPTSPPGPDVLESIERAPVLERFDGLGAFFGAGRKLTATGHPTLADARELIDRLMLPDVINPSIGDKVWRTRSSSNLPELTFTVLWAQQAGAIRKRQGKLAQTTTWTKASSTERFRRVAQALVSLGPLQARHSRAWTVFQEVFAVVDHTFPSLLMRLAEGPLRFERAVDHLLDYMQRRYVWGGLLEDSNVLRKEMHDDLRTTVTVLGVAGMASIDDEGMIELTPAGWWVISELKLPPETPPVYPSAASTSSAPAALNALP